MRGFLKLLRFDDCLNRMAIDKMELTIKKVTAPH